MAEDKTKTDDNRRAQLKVLAKSGKKGMDQVRAMSNGKDRDAFLARSVIREMGGKEGAEAMPSGDKEPTTTGYKKGGMVKCGASNPPSQKSSQSVTKMAKGGMSTLKKPPQDAKGLKKLPTTVRNKMGYMSRGGKATKK